MNMFWAVIVSFVFMIQTASALEVGDGAAVETPACASIPGGQKARLLNDGKSYILLATFLEDQGRGHLRPEYDAPESVCALETFQAGDLTVKATYAGLTKGMMTLLYRFEAAGAEPREILVIYSGMLSFMNHKDSQFGVLEVNGDKVDLYAIYNGEPTYKQVRALAEGVLMGREAPMLSAEWQDGEDELIITVYDGKRLK